MRASHIGMGNHWALLLALAFAAPAPAEIPPTYSIQLDPYGASWMALDALAFQGIPGETRAQGLSDTIRYLRHEGTPDERGCYIAGEEPHAPNQNGYRAIEAFRESPDAAHAHANLIVTGTVRGAKVGTSGSSVGTLIELDVETELKRDRVMNDLLADLQRSGGLDVIYIFVRFARFEWEGEAVCLRDSRFTSVPKIGDEVAVLVSQDHEPERCLGPEQRRDRQRLVESGELEVWPLNAERVMFLSGDTTAVFQLDGEQRSNQVWKGRDRRFESRRQLQEWLENGQ